VAALAGSVSASANTVQRITNAERLSTIHPFLAASGRDRCCFPLVQRPAPPGAAVPLCNACWRIVLQHADSVKSIARGETLSSG
jgi:hypothetical protein